MTPATAPSQHLSLRMDDPASAREIYAGLPDAVRVVLEEAHERILMAAPRNPDRTEALRCLREAGMWLLEARR